MSIRFISIVVAPLIVCLNAVFAQSQAIVISPVPNSTLTGSSVTFQWTPSAVATAYWIDVGSVAGGNQYYQSGSLSTSTLSATVSDLPTNGSTIYVTMYSLINTQWVNNAYTYTAFNAAAAAGVLTTPTPGSTLTGSTVTFMWSAGSGATAYWLDIGTLPGGNTIYQSGNLGNVTSTTVNGLPTNGTTIYVTLYSLSSGQWVSNAYTYTAFNAATGLAVMQTPIQGSRLSGNTAIFTWSSDPSATAYWLDIGNVPGANTYYQSGNLGNVLTTTVYSLPANGSTVYATLYSLMGGQWLNNAYTYVSAPLQLPSQAEVLGAIENVNNFWIPNNNYIVLPGEIPGNSDWDQATYFTGDLAAYDATGQANYLSFAQSWASQNNYSLIGGNKTTDADHQAAGQAYIRLYQLSNTSSDLSGITESIDGMVKSKVYNEWTWVDAINMSMPNFAELGSIYNDTNYYTKMYALYSYPKYSLGLYDSTTGLWWRDITFVNTSTYWSRGNGWAFAAHAKVLSVLPQSDPHYAEYLSTFITMAQALAERQQPGGYWNSDLGGTDYAGPESSGTSLFLYGLGWGLNTGILDRNTYLPVVERAWNFLANTAIQPSGLLGYVQPSPACNCPGPTSASTTFDYGVGAFLLAGRQMALLTQ
jgi:unsaturated rhamnogalacturonyl hydrolase